MEENKIISKNTETINEVLESVPKDKRAILLSLLQVGIEQVSPETELMKKINEKHIDQFLKTADKEVDNDIKDKRERRIFCGVIALFLLIFFSFIILVFKDRPDVVEKIIYTTGGAILGGLGGYGYGQNKRD